MTAASAETTIYPARTKKDFRLRVGANVKIWKGVKCAVKNSYLVPITATTGLKHVCTATETVDNLGGSAGAKSCNVEFDEPKSLVRFENDTTSPITSSHIGESCYGLDNVTVTADEDSGARSRVGTPWIVIGTSDAIGQRAGVYVELDSAASGGAGAATEFQFSASSELTIASDAITVTQAYHTVDTEADASTDNLDTISGTVAGSFYLLKAENASRTVVIRDTGGGTGNIRTPHAQSISLAEATDGVLLFSNGSTVTVLGYCTKAGDGGGAGALIGLLADLDTTDKSSIVAALNETYGLVIAAPAMQAVDATLASGTVTINSGVTLAADSEVIPHLIGDITGTTNFGGLRELKASRVNGAPGVGTVVIEAVTTTPNAVDADAAGAIRVVILTPQV